MSETALPCPAIGGTKPILVTGGAGFIGSNLAHRLAQSGRNVLILDSLVRAGVERNLAELKHCYPREVSFEIADIRSDAAVDAVREASAVVHFAAQVAVTTSIEGPLDDFDVNTRGTLNLLEAARSCLQPPTFLFASTNKVYGDLGDLDLDETDVTYHPRNREIAEHGVCEARPLSFHTPYGCSKGAADQYVLDYARTLGVPAAVFRMSCIYGPRQLGTEDQGWVAHFLLSVLRDEPITIFGDGRQVRDILFVDDATEIYAQAIENPPAVLGRAFNVGGGPGNAVSLLQVLSYIEQIVGRPIKIRLEHWRSGDQRYYVSDTRALRSSLQLSPATPWKAGIALLAESLKARGRRPLNRQHEPEVVFGGAP